MPIHTGQDKNGEFYQWGKTGKKYYFSNEETKKVTKRKAEKQQTAIYSSGWKGDSFMKLIRVKKKDMELATEDQKIKKEILSTYDKLTEKLRKAREEVEKEYHSKIGSLVSKLSFKPQEDADIRNAEFLFRQAYDLKGTNWR